MTHPGPDDLAAYAIGGLDPAEEEVVFAHVEACDRCRSELAQLAPAVGVLAESVEQREPPPGLRARLLDEVAADAAPAAAETPRRRSPRRRFSFGGMLLRPAAGLAAAAVAIAGVGGYLIAKDEDAGPAEDTFAVSSPMPAAGGTLVVEGGEATMHVHGMPPLKKGGVYQVWVAAGGQVVPSATFVPHEDGTATAAVPEAVDDADEVMVTAEPRAGRSSPTLPAVLDVRLD
ncbi:MAG: anti-sigma factor [Solirubrobacterales bacterium]